MKPIAWYDPTNGMISTDKDSPLFTPLGQVWPLYPEREWVGLTEQEHKELAIECGCLSADWVFYGAALEQKIKEKNEI